MKRLIFIFLIISKLTFGQDEAFFYHYHFDIAPNKTYKKIHRTFYNGFDLKNNHKTIEAIDSFNKNGRLIKTEIPLTNQTKSITEYTYDSCSNLISEIKYSNNNFIKSDSSITNFTYLTNCQPSTTIRYSNIDRFSTGKRSYKIFDTIKYTYNKTNNITSEIHTSKDSYSYDNSSVKKFYYNDDQIIKAIKTIPWGNFVDTIIQSYSYDQQKNLVTEKKTRIEEREITDSESKLYYISEKINYSYDNKNRLTKTKDNQSKIKYSYNDLNQLIKVRVLNNSIFWRILAPTGFKEIYTYNNDGNLDEIIKKSHLFILGLISYKSEYRVTYY
jgi:YD repeat-containing protein